MTRRQTTCMLRRPSPAPWPQRRAPAHLRVGRLVGEVGLISSRSTDLRAAIEVDGRTLLQRIRRIAPQG